MNPMQKLRLMVARGVVRLINDAGGLQVLQVDGLAGETIDGVERVQNFGLTSHPPPGSIPAMVSVGGSRDHMLAVAVDHPESRPKDLKQGESAMYNAHGILFLFDDKGIATLNCKKLVINASDGVDGNTPLAHFSAQLTADAKITGNGGMAISGGDGATVSGKFVQTDGQLSSNGIVLDGHRHHYDGGTTDGPVS